MASVLINGFQMPNNCGACPLRLAWCKERIYMVTRPPRCPLIELQLEEITAAHEQIGYNRGFNDGYASALFDEEEDENWYTELDDPKFDERSEDGIH